MIDKGMDLRDYFAAQVLPAIHLGFVFRSMFFTFQNLPQPESDYEGKEAIGMAYEYADEMMRHREKQ